MAGKPRPRKKPPADLVQRVVEAMARKHRTTVKDIMSRSLFHEHMKARREAMWLIWSHGRGAYSLPGIGEVFGRHHATVLHNVRSYDQERAAA